MAMNHKIDRYTPHSNRAGQYRSLVKRCTQRKSRRLGKEIAKGNEKAEGQSLTHGWAD